MRIEITANPNSEGSEEFFFNELEPPRPIAAIRVGEGASESRCDVVGIDAGGRPVQAYAVKITDSGAGYAYLLFGGAWGIRLRPAQHAEDPWDLKNTRQWGEPFKIYGEERDIIYK